MYRKRENLNSLQTCLKLTQSTASFKRHPKAFN